KNLCSPEDVQIICRCVDNSSQEEGSRELLSRITKKKDWFPTFVTVLHEMDNKELIETLTGVTYQEFIDGYNKKRESHNDSAKCKRSPQVAEGVSDGSPATENHDV
ncbi:unnamed protein product, partial [Staurois parvus]